MPNRFRSLAAVSELLDPNRLKARFRGKIPAFGSPTGSKPASRKVLFPHPLLDFIRFFVLLVVASP